MNNQPITDQIYNRYRNALQESAFIDDPTVRMALWLSLTEQAERLSAEPAPQVKLAARGYWQELVSLAEYLRDHGHLDGATDIPLDAIVPHTMAIIDNLALVNSRLSTPGLASDTSELQRLHAWLDDNIAPPQEQPVSIVDRAMDAIRHLQDAWAAEAAANAGLHEINASLTSGLAAAQNEAGMLRQQRGYMGERIHALETEISSLRTALSDLQERLGAKSIDLENEIMNNALLREELAQFKAGQAAPVALASPNGNGHAAPAADFLASKADLPEGLSPVAEAAWRSCQQGASFRRLPAAIRLELVQAVLRQAELGQPMKMSEYDALKPSWMPSANGMPTVFGCTWLDLPNQTPDRIKATA